LDWQESQLSSVSSAGVHRRERGERGEDAAYLAPSVLRQRVVRRALKFAVRFGGDIGKSLRPLRSLPQRVIKTAKNAAGT
jgi:hypothetical protein